MNEITFEEDVTRSSTDCLAADLARAQAEMSNPKFDSQNPHFKNKFASLAAIRDAAVPVLAKHGIALVQDLTNTEGGICCVTTLLHSSGQSWVSKPLTMPAAQTNPQAFGSAATYCKRYQLMAVCGIVGDADDDAEAAVGRSNGISPNSAVNSGKAPTLEAQLIASNFQAAVKANNADKIREIAFASNTDHDIYLDAWRLLDSKTRSFIKRVIDDKPKADDANGNHQ